MTRIIGEQRLDISLQSLVKEPECQVGPFVVRNQWVQFNELQYVVAMATAETRRARRRRNASIVVSTNDKDGILTDKRSGKCLAMVERISNVDFRVTQNIFRDSDADITDAESRIFILSFDRSYGPVRWNVTEEVTNKVLAVAFQDKYQHVDSYNLNVAKTENGQFILAVILAGELLNPSKLHRCTAFRLPKRSTSAEKDKVCADTTIHDLY